MHPQAFTNAIPQHPVRGVFYYPQFIGEVIATIILNALSVQNALNTFFHLVFVSAIVFIPILQMKEAESKRS